MNYSRILRLSFNSFDDWETSLQNPSQITIEVVPPIYSFPKSKYNSSRLFIFFTTSLISEMSFNPLLHLIFFKINHFTKWAIWTFWLKECDFRPPSLFLQPSCHQCLWLPLLKINEYSYFRSKTISFKLFS